jgi:hypothetical protein
MLEDERSRSNFVGNYTSWSAHCSGHLRQPKCDIGSIEANPKLSSNFTPISCSKAVSLSHDFNVPDDFYGRSRPAGAQTAGAVLSESYTSLKAMPPIPLAFANYPSYFGLAPVVAYYNTYSWPFWFWLTRTCKDIIVDSVHGHDNQTFDYLSNYKPFRTIQQALTNINQCDRILLRGNQTHYGNFGIYRPNVTIMTHPDDDIRALVFCNNTANSNCIMFGDGFYDGAAAATLSNFDIKMAGVGGFDCIHLNEGYGGGYSPYWKFYVDKSGRSAYDK